MKSICEVLRRANTSGSEFASDAGFGQYCHKSFMVSVVPSGNASQKIDAG
jgi:hypothetical protein